jgi:hypothetical protein
MHRQIFAPTVTKIVQHLKGILQNMQSQGKPSDYVFLVGGFAESEVVRFSIDQMLNRLEGYKSKFVLVSVVTCLFLGMLWPGFGLIFCFCFSSSVVVCFWNTFECHLNCTSEPLFLFCLVYLRAQRNRPWCARNIRPCRC